MVRINLTEENLISTTGVADRRFADHSGDIQHGYELGSLTRGLVAYYPMEEGQGQVLHDGATGNQGSFNGTPSWAGSGQVGSNSLNFTPTDDVSTPDAIPPAGEIYGFEDQDGSKVSGNYQFWTNEAYDGSVSFAVYGSSGSVDYAYVEPHDGITFPYQGNTFEAYVIKNDVDPRFRINFAYDTKPPNETNGFMAGIDPNSGVVRLYNRSTGESQEVAHTFNPNTWYRWVFDWGIDTLTADLEIASTDNNVATMSVSTDGARPDATTGFSFEDNNNGGGHTNNFENGPHWDFLRRV